jgi:hypothetical protein
MNFMAFLYHGLIYGGNVMNQNIINQLIQCNRNYEENYQNFAFKNDLTAVFDLECREYFAPLATTIIPELLDELEAHPEDKIEGYLPFIAPKYHKAVVTEITSQRNDRLNFAKNLSKKIIFDFTAQAVTYYKKTDKEKAEFITEFHKANHDFLENIAQHSVELLVNTVAQLRNPKLQYLCIHHLSDASQQKTQSFFNTMNKQQLDTMIKKYFCYPLDISVEQYYVKWLSKEIIHIKFAKNLIGSRYDYTKLLLKMAHKNKTPELIEYEEKMQAA